jgi:diguanylate cyclase (GGDEF)-like protein
MSFATLSLFDPVNGDFEAVAGELRPQQMARRRQRRRQILAVAGSSHVINVALLALFAFGGTISFGMVGLFAAAAFLSVGVFVVLSETGISDAWQDHFFAAPYTGATFLILLAFIDVAPEVAVVFLHAILLVATTIALRSSIRQGVAAWIMITIGVAAVYMGAGLPLSLPFGNAYERAGTLMTFSLTIGRILFIGIFASTLRDTLFRRSAELAEAYQRIEQLAELDELTGAFNRRCIMRMLDDEISRAQRSNTPCTIALIDLDWFKRINDAFGHPTGDEVLRTFAITIFANIRGADKFGRHGGEEFLLVLPDTSAATAARMLERLRDIVATLDWSAFSDRMAVTISAGMATLTAVDTADTLLARADSALYAAKERGRNRVACA